MSATSVFHTASSSATTLGPGERFVPRPVDSVDQLGISQNILVDLMLKMTLLEGETTLSRVARHMKVGGAVAGAVFSHLRKEQYVEVKGMVGNDYALTLSGQGRRLAQDRYQINQYVGPAPVSLDAYIDAVRTQAARHKVNRERLQEAFAALVLPDAMLDQLGP